MTTEPRTGGIDLRDVTVVLGDRPVVSAASLTVDEGEWLTLIGPNGAGKTTLLRAVAGLVDHSGSIRIGDAEVARLPRRRAARLVAMVPQGPVVPAGTTVADYVLLGRTPFIPYLGVESAGDLRAAGDLLERLDLAALAGRELGSLSGGELQRAVLARALAQQAPVLLLDEPTSALDVGHQQQVLELVDALRAEHGLTVVSAMHDLTVAGQFADRLLLLAGGRPVALGTARAILTEEMIATHYGARVRVLELPGGGVAVVPVRQVPAPPPGEPGRASAQTRRASALSHPRAEAP